MKLSLGRSWRVMQPASAPSRNRSLGGFFLIASTPGLYPRSRAATWLATLKTRKNGTYITVKIALQHCPVTESFPTNFLWDRLWPVKHIENLPGFLHATADARILSNGWHSSHYRSRILALQAAAPNHNNRMFRFSQDLQEDTKIQN